MATYTITTSKRQDDALTWCLAEQKRTALDPKTAPKTVSDLVHALATDRINQVVTQAEAATRDVVAALKDADDDTIEEVRQVLARRQPVQPTQ